MVQAASLVINDGQATPVATTFTPEGISPSLSSFADRASGIAMTFRRLKISSKFAGANSVVNRNTLEVVIPVGQVVNGVTSVAYTLRGKLELILPDQATAANRADLYAFIQNALANTAMVRPALRDMDPLY